MLRKVITYFLLCAVILPVFASAVPLPSPSNGRFWGVKISHAIDKTEQQIKDEEKAKIDAEIKKQEKQSAEVNGVCDIFWGKGTFVGCAMWLFADAFLYKIVLKMSVLVASIAGTMFNISIGFSLTGDIFDAGKNKMINDGWTYVRDLLNLVFIFILLYAAISTILQYGNTDIKKILPSLIVAALLVNFSMMISKMVIDASHVFAWEFYNQIKVDTRTVDVGTANQTEVAVANIDDEIQVLPAHGNFEKKNLANVFIAGFNPQVILTGDNKNPSAFASAIQDAQDKGETKTIFSLMTQMIIILILESVLALFGGFVLLAGAVMFVLRVVVLWMVMIFSPLAFLGMILPSMKKYSDMWWGYLIGQSFFAPAFLFMFMLVAKFISSDFIDSIIQVTKDSNLKIALGLNPAVIIIPIFHFIVVGGLMMMCLIVAKQMGGKTAEFGIKGRDLVLGGAKKLAWSPTRFGLRHGGGWLADKTLDKEKGWGEKGWAKTLSSIPGVGIGLRKLGAMKKADEDATRRAAEKKAGTFSSVGRKSLETDIKDKGFVGRFLRTGLEGAWKPGKEGYEKVIAKKREEEKEKKLYYESWAELYNKTKSDPTEKDVNAEDMKKRIEKGELGIMEEEAEKRRKEFDEKKEQEKEDNNLKISKKSREIARLETELAEQRKKGEVTAAKLTENVIDGLDKEISNLNKLNNEITVIDKVLGRHEKKIESYRSRELSKSKPVEEKREEKKKD